MSLGFDKQAPIGLYSQDHPSGIPAHLVLKLGKFSSTNHAVTVHSGSSVDLEIGPGEYAYDGHAPALLFGLSSTLELGSTQYDLSTEYNVTRSIGVQQNLLAISYNYNQRMVIFGNDKVCKFFKSDALKVTPVFSSGRLKIYPIN